LDGSIQCLIFNDATEFDNLTARHADIEILDVTNANVGLGGLNVSGET